MLNKRAMALIEIMVAFALGSIALLPLIQLFRSSARVASFSVEESAGIIHGSNILDYFLALNKTEAKKATDPYKNQKLEFKGYAKKPFKNMKPTKLGWNYKVLIKAVDVQITIPPNNKKDYRSVHIYIQLFKGKSKTKVDREIKLSGAISI
ncbi:PilW family protein [Candidatus Riflebacteria bacterium]